MAMERDIEWVGRMGEKRMPNKDEGSGKEKDMADELQETFHKGMKTRAMAAGLGFMPTPEMAGAQTGTGGKDESASKESQSFAASIITKSMELMDTQNKRLETSIEEERKKAKEAADAGQQAQEQMHKDRLEFFKILQGQLEGAKRTSDIEVFKQVHEAFQAMQPDKKEMGPAIVDGNLTLQLEQMRENHDLKIQELNDNRSERQRQWEMEMAKWKDESELRWAEYKDKRDMRDRASGGFMQMVAAIVDGIEKDQQAELGTVATATPTQEAAERPPSKLSQHQNPPQTQQSVTLPCPSCDTPIEIHRGDTKVICSQCGSDHEVVTE